MTVSSSSNIDNGNIIAVGVFSRHPRGFGFVKPDDGSDDIFVPPHEAAKCLNGDRVRIRLVFDPIKQKSYGEISQVVEHTLRFVAGKYVDTTGRPYVEPSDPSITRPIMIVEPFSTPIQPSSVVMAEIIDHGDYSGEMSARVVEVVGQSGSYQAEIASVCIKHKVPYRISCDLTDELAAVPEGVANPDHVGRRDLRDLSFFTIDGDDSKDFDDAVALVSQDGVRKLLVAIADVSHYVKPGSAIDECAYTRGTSVYFPGFCLPMLPEKISNGICSLNPGVDRLAVVCELSYGPDAKVVGSRFFEAVIHSKARLTYDGVDKFFAGKEGCSDPAVATSLTEMRALAAQLRAGRIGSGSIEFRSSEVKIEIGPDGAPASLARQQSTESRQLIEAFMVAANEAVAKYLQSKKQDALYRVHLPPEESKIQSIRELLIILGIDVPYSSKKHEKDEERMVKAVAGTVHEPLINEMLIRSMEQASYSHRCHGHYGLGLTHYLHFTSPIRRYPDLIVHRALKAALGLAEYKNGKLAPGEVAPAGGHLSARERAAMLSERDIVRLKSCQFMDGKRGRDYKATVRNVSPQGLFVEIDKFPISGFVHISQLSDEYMEYDSNRYALIGSDSGDVFCVGSKVDVRVKDIDFVQNNIEFSVTYAYGEDEW